MQYNEKGQESSVNGYNYKFSPLNFPNLGHLDAKRYVDLKVFTGNKLFYFSIRALLAVTARNKWLEKSPARYD